MSSGPAPPRVLKYLDRVRTSADFVAPGGLTVEELRRSISSSLTAGADILGRARRLKQQGVPSHDPAAMTEAVLREVMTADAASRAVKEIHEQIHRLPPNPEHAGFAYWVTALNLQLLRHTAGKFYDETPLPWIDIIDLGHVNACVTRLDGEYILLFQSGAKAFTNLISKAFIAVQAELGMATGGRPELLAAGSLGEVLSGLKATQTFESIIHAYLFQGHPVGGEIAWLGEREAGVASIIERSMDRFVIGHEYAHVLERHQPGNIDHEMELKADGVGLLLMLDTMRPEWPDLVMPFTAAHLIVAMQECITTAVYKIVGRPVPLHAHPRAWHRSVNLMATCERRGALTSVMEQCAVGFVQSFLQLWAVCEPHLLNEARGRALAPIWI